MKTKPIPDDLSIHAICQFYDRDSKRTVTSSLNQLRLRNISTKNLRLVKVLHSF